MEHLTVQAIKPTKAVVFVPAPNGLAKVLFSQGAYVEIIVVPGQVLQVVRTNPATKELTVSIFPMTQYAVEFTVPMVEPPVEEVKDPAIAVPANVN